MRALHIYSGNLFGGVERLLTTLATFAPTPPRLEHEFALCFPGRLSQELAAAEALVHQLDPVRARYPWTVMRGRAELAGLLRLEAVEVAICHSSWPLAIFGPAVREAGLPLVLWVHDDPRRSHWVDRWSARHPPDFAICNSQYTQNGMRRFYPDIRSDVVYCPSAAPGSCLTSTERARLRKELGASEGEAVIFLAARMDAWKGQALLVSALNELATASPWKCWIAGGAQRPQEVQFLASLERTVHENGLSSRVNFLGERVDVSRLMQAADVYCQPNLNPEPFGLSFIEALYAGLPIVSTDIGGGAAEIVTPACGRLTESSPTSLAAALAELIDDPHLRADMQPACRHRAASLCDPQQQLGRLADVLSSIAQHEPVLA